MPVFTPPGATPFTRTPWAAASTPIWLISPMVAYLEAVYAAPPPPDASPATDAVITMLPPVFFSSSKAA
ncbi:hypothetical protein PG2T_13005 [Immundisolibacter cernigliae]|uniref:Uncharacterized protein n=1 Tax=Immundisolibacter cernigliae TaxID=1810504 RepID=A0A1B1YW48_9GAMM|nr:hypothetical protein [Immundisolibacter cernigliae]ANX05002.1 hypothetical protein PG2T_13005 [Immundisolibacter cernigliae]